LLKLSAKVQALVSDGKLSAGHARMLVGQANADDLAQDIVARGLNVRQVEELSREKSEQRGDRAPRAAKQKDADTKALEKRVSDILGLTVSVDHRGDAGGTVHIKYRDLDQLDEIMKRLARG
ncbi:MAG TPA: chromosome partitioning protein ParB, partial [Xanthobacteraceae bacterium]|nr:chromosome partitioning protein ParB [Xanthobacteraceae bacterium]